MTDVRLVLLRHAKDNVLDPEQQLEMEWEDFCSWLQEEGHEVRGIAGEPERFEGEFKEGTRGATRPAGMVLADPRWGHPAMDDDVDIDFIERKGEDVLRRAKRNFDGACGVVAIDLDDLSVEEHVALRERLRRFDAVEYSTYSHGKKAGIVKLRLIVRLDREQAVGEVSRVRRGAGLLLDVRVDTQTIDISRIFYRPAAHPDRAEQAFIYVHSGGDALCVDACLAEAPVTEHEILASKELVWDGITPASHHEQMLARAELDDWLARCSRMTGDESKRKWLLQRTMRFGSYILSGCLPGEETRQRMHARVRELMEHAWAGDDHSVEYRLAQIDKGLSDAKVGLLPVDKVAAVAAMVTEQAETLGVSPEITEKLVALSGEARRALIANTPDELVDLEVARKRSFDFGMGLERGTLRVDSSSAGTGKSYNIAKIASAHARAGRLVVIQTRENIVAAQTKEQVDPDVACVQLYSPLRPPVPFVPESHRCRRADELAYLAEAGRPVRSVCTKCPFNEACPALDAHRERLEKLGSASVVFVSQAGIGQARELLEEQGALLISDEQPDTGEWDDISDETLERFAAGERIPWVPAHGKFDVSGLLAGVAQACLGRGELQEYRDEEFEIPSEAWKDLPESDKDTLRIGRKLWEVFTRDRQFSRIDGKTRLWKLDKAYQALLSYGGLLCDATPFRPAFPRDMHIEELRQHVRDSAPVKRASVWCPNRTGSSALYPEGVVDRRRVEETLERVRFYAQRERAKSILLVTFKAVRVWLDSHREEVQLPAGMEVAHFGAVRGKNAWKDFDLIYVFGTPRFDRKALLEHLLKDTVRVREEWARCAAAELEQAIARLRPVSRATPCTMVCESEVVPWSWYAGMPNFEIRLLPEDETRAEATRRLMAWHEAGITRRQLAVALGYDPDQEDVTFLSQWRKRGVPKEKAYLVLAESTHAKLFPDDEQPDIEV